MTDNALISAGYVAGVFGIKGAVKVFSHTDPRENILHYSPWLLKKNNQEQSVKVVSGHRQGHSVVVSLDGVSDRNLAEELIGWEIWIRKEDLPKPDPGEYYWLDLIGLEVRNTEAVFLGRVDHLLETGANDVLVVVDGQIERLIPFVQPETVKSVDLSAGQMVVDWDPDF